MNEFWRAYGADVAISMIPGANGNLIVAVDGEVLFDRLAEDKIYPDMYRVRAMKERIQEKLDAVVAHADD